MASVGALPEGEVEAPGITPGAAGSLMARNLAKTRLVLVTSKYPFSQGEEFLETEIPFLSQAFDEVVVLPSSRLTNWEEVSRAPRPLPSNVSVPMDAATRLQADLRRPRLQRALDALRDTQARTDLITELAHALRLGPAAMKNLMYFMGNGVHIRNALLELVGNRGAATVLYSYWLTGAAWAAGQAAAQMGVACVARAHGGDLYRDRHRPPYLPLQCVTVGRLDGLFTVSAHGLAYAQRVCPAHIERMQLSRLGVSAAQSPSREGTGGVVHLLSCSSLIPVKRIALLIDALARCRSTVHWTHIGGGPQLEEMTTRCAKLPDNVSWRLLGHMPLWGVQDYYEREAIDLFVNVSASEGLPVSIMEALRSGVPVIAPAVGGIAELVDEQTGWLLDSSPSPTAIASAIDAFAATTAEERRAKRLAAVEAWRQRVDAERQYAEFAATLRRIALASRAR